VSELRLEIPMIPPSGNHYKSYRIVFPKDPRQKAFVQWYLTPEAEAFYGCVRMVAAGRRVLGRSLEVSYIVFLPTARKSDTDNYSKCIWDSLKHAGVIEDDRYIDDGHQHRRHDPLNPRTVVVIKTPQEQLL